MKYNKYDCFYLTKRKVKEFFEWLKNNENQEERKHNYEYIITKKDDNGIIVERFSNGIKDDKWVIGCYYYRYVNIGEWPELPGKIRATNICKEYFKE